MQGQYKRRAPYRQGGFTLIELMIVVAIIGILAAIAIPQYQNYVARSQMSRAMAEASTGRTAVETCMMNGQNLAACNLGFSPSSILVGAFQGTQANNNNVPPGTGVPQVVITPAANTATITAVLGNDTAAAITGANVVWTRNANGSWACTANAGNAPSWDASFNPCR
ncbi:pilin [Salinicola tamaricis]|uniref:pilin n=1 Tax=Salinicola tamaricis TaxID=1771309 RepID=UPI000D09B8E1|nr:pilin [Salinicola tamaricis]